MINDVIPSLRSRTGLSAAKNLPCDGQMLHFVQHDNPSNKLRQSTRSVLSTSSTIAVNLGNCIYLHRTTRSKNFESCRSGEFFDCNGGKVFWCAQKGENCKGFVIFITLALLEAMVIDSR